MKRATCFAVSVFLFAVAILAGQSNHAPSHANTVIKPSYSTSGGSETSGTMCPVRIRALQGTGYGLVKVRGEQQVEGPSQRIHLLLTNPKSKQLAGAEIVVSGLSPKSHALSRGDRPSDLTKAMEITFTSESENTVSADLLLLGFTSVTSIELKSISYRDGTTWTVADHQACQAAPDPLMLIANQ